MTFSTISIKRNNVEIYKFNIEDGLANKYLIFSDRTHSSYILSKNSNDELIKNGTYNIDVTAFDKANNMKTDSVNFTTNVK